MEFASEHWPEDGIETLGACPMCGVVARQSVHRGLRDLIFRCAGGQWDLWRCLGCRNAYLDPRPSPDSIVLAYGNYYTHIPPALSENPDSRLMIARRAMANGYRNWRYGSRLAPAYAIGAALLLGLPSARSAIDLTLRYLPKPPANRRGRVLDVGCGNGAFLEQARLAGWEADGCDFDPKTAAGVRARGFDIREGSIDAWSDAAGQFDAITFSHVIEHLHDPAAALVQAWQLLRVGGMIFIDTPNLDSAGHREFGRSWRGLEPPRHLVLYNWPGMIAALRAAGFADPRRVPRPGVYGGLAAQSAAIRDGRDPALAIDNQTRLQRWRTRLRERLHPQASEFVTLIATKRGRTP